MDNKNSLKLKYFEGRPGKVGGSLPTGQVGGSLPKRNPGRYPGTRKGHKNKSGMDDGPRAEIEEIIPGMKIHPTKIVRSDEIEKAE